MLNFQNKEKRIPIDLVCNSMLVNVDQLNFNVNQFACLLNNIRSFGRENRY